MEGAHAGAPFTRFAQAFMCIGKTHIHSYIHTYIHTYIHSDIHSKDISDQNSVHSFVGHIHHLCLARTRTHIFVTV
jgi:hypothetical protein